ncbi:hypothetical protein DL771_005007 [Monosporascus sp. 5C6A]|nr:hypothetical protein DL771_005007 [Monosporascus sp. 5C6A]
MAIADLNMQNLAQRSGLEDRRTNSGDLQAESETGMQWREFRISVQLDVIIKAEGPRVDRDSDIIVITRAVASVASNVSRTIGHEDELYDMSLGKATSRIEYLCHGSYAFFDPQDLPNTLQNALDQLDSYIAFEANSSSPSSGYYKVIMAQFRLDGFAIVVGAAGGIGREVALTFAEAGVKGILLADINSEALAQVADQSKALASNPNYRSISTTVNVADVASVDALVSLAKEQFDRIDYCVNAFGVDVAAYVPFDETDPDDYDRVLGINTKGVFLVTRAVAKVMKSQEPVSVDLGRHGFRDVGRGAIVNVSSAMALVAVPAKVPYTTSKHAVTGVTKAAVTATTRREPDDFTDKPGKDPGRGENNILQRRNTDRVEMDVIGLLWDVPGKREIQGQVTWTELAELFDQFDPSLVRCGEEPGFS